MIAQYTQAAIVSEMKRLAVPGVRRLDPVVRHAGGPRVDGLERRPQATPLGRRPVPRRRHRAADRGPRPRLAPAARARRRHRRRGRPAARRTASRAPAPTAICPRRSRPRSRSSSPARCSPPSSRRSEMLTVNGLSSTTPPAHPRRPRHRADREVLADRGAAADADEQPRPRGGRGTCGPRRVRRHRQGRAQLAGVRRDRPLPARPRGRRDPARAVGQAGRRDAHPRVGAARADRQLQPGRRLGQLGGVPEARGPRADDVRPDDRRLVDLHRHPGDPAGHVRDVRGGGRQAVRRHARRHDHADRRARRHGRRAAAGRDDERRRRDLRRRRPVADHPPHRAPLPRRAGRLPGGRRRSGGRRARRASAAVDRRARATRPSCSRSCWR